MIWSLEITLTVPLILNLDSPPPKKSLLINSKQIINMFLTVRSQIKSTFGPSSVVRIGGYAKLFWNVVHVIQRCKIKVALRHFKVDPVLLKLFKPLWIYLISLDLSFMNLSYLAELPIRLFKYFWITYSIYVVEPSLDVAQIH